MKRRKLTEISRANSVTPLSAVQNIYSMLERYAQSKKRGESADIAEPDAA